MKKITALMITLIMAMALVLTACGGKKDSDSGEPAQGSSVAPAPQTSGIDYMALVNKLNPLPDGWEEALETVHFTNTVGDDVEVEKKAYDAYLELKAELEKEGIYVDLDSARRSVADQERIMNDFIEKYGQDYAFKTVAKPGYSEHHTGLALNLYLIIDGQDIVENEDMVQYPEIWAKIHAKLADHGFILRYLEGREHLTGYGYEPWHIRYIDDVATAKEIMEKDITLEEYLGTVKSADVTIELGDSDYYTEEELMEAVVQIKCKFASFSGCELHSIRYAGDETNLETNIARMNAIVGEDKYAECAEFLMDFHTPPEGSDTLKPDEEYKDYQWWLAREADGGLELVTWGY
ncbi:MAG: M15 family metallopeptidase [Lachnospiraceae bacterium]|nr:M15 family metallopeptidase [Lachnospiraceae bacterium]